MRKAAKEVGLQELLHKGGVQAMGFLTELISDPEAKPELRLKAAEKVLERALENSEAAVSAPEQQVIAFEGELDEWSR